jgi:guanylate kinase
MDNAVSIFILPPSYETLQQRLNQRGQDSAEVIQRRMDDAMTDMQQSRHFEYIVINDDFDTAVNDLQTIFKSHRLRRDQVAKKANPFIKNLITI